MTKLIWDQVGEKTYETGVDRGVLYPQNSSGLYPLGVAWNGLTGVTESPSGAEPSPLFADNIKYLNLMSAEEFGATIEAYTYPDEFALCDGSAALSAGVYIGQQNRGSFGLAYRTVFGNDTEGAEYGYKLHLIYGAMAKPSEKGYQTINDSPDAITFSWEIATTPVVVTGKKPTASLTIDSTKVDAAALAALEAILYGTAGADPRLPLPDEVAALFTAGAPDALVISSISPADDEPAAPVNSNIIVTFNNAINSGYINVVSEAGELVEGVGSWDAAKKIYTFNPTSDLGAATGYIVTIAGVVDVYNQALATTVKNFTTA